MMNTSLKTSAVVLAAFAIITAAGASPTASVIQSNKAPQTLALQTVTISAKRLNISEKKAYDHEQASHAVQTVIISAKRLSPQAKVAFDKANASQFQANVLFNKTIRQTT